MFPEIQNERRVSARGTAPGLVEWEPVSNEENRTKSKRQEAMEARGETSNAIKNQNSILLELAAVV